ncbi:MAG: DUF111 family protein [Bacillota bacterium]|nr:DUF111 family protein [Bacillota bacterium]
MKTLYIDCTSGISGDMLLQGLTDIAGGSIDIPEIHDHHHDHDHSHGNGHDHDHHGRSYEDVKHIIDHAEEHGVSSGACGFARNIYGVIARAEASVHEMTLETVHFHEVGRDQAIQNALGIGMALDKMGFDPEPARSAGRILVSPIYDGQGFVDCAHGRIPVPVPAVKAMMAECGDHKGPGHGFDFRTAEDVDTEMVTPSGLAALMGIGAEPAEKGFALMGRITAETEAKGTRDTGRGGLRIYLIED